MNDDLTTWLLEQISEDDSVAREQRRFEQYVEGTGRLFSTSHAIVSMAPHRAVAEHEAKRLILAIHRRAGSLYSGDRDDPRCVGCGFDSDEEPVTTHVEQCPILRALALPYADRPGYREEWRP